MWISLGCVSWCPWKPNSPFGEFLTYLIISLIPSKAIVSCEFERVAAAMPVLLNIQAPVQLLFQRSGQSRSQNLNPANPRRIWTGNLKSRLSSSCSSGFFTWLISHLIFHVQDWGNGEKKPIYSSNAGELTWNCRRRGSSVCSNLC